jgi:hypothetical protein
MLNKLRKRLFLLSFVLATKVGEKIMSDTMKKKFAATYITLILEGRYTINDVPPILLPYVNPSLGIE